MKLPFINESIFEPYKSLVEEGKFSYIHNKDLMQESKSMKFIELVNKINGYINYL